MLPALVIPGFVFLLVWGAVVEHEGSMLQARIFTGLASDMTFEIADGENHNARFPAYGPYDSRLGYTSIPAFVETLQRKSYTVERQAVASEKLNSFADRGGFSIYREKAQAGITIRDRNGWELYSKRYPERAYPNFSTVPSLIYNSLLFIENRELLEAAIPTRNPAIEWDRLGVAVLGRMAGYMGEDVGAGGGSTLATQMEKFRHSEGGQTTGIVDKLRQMISASVRAYVDGPDTMAARRRIVVDYLNSTPLAARPGFGEVHGIGDGLWAWFGADFEEMNRLLSDESGKDDKAAELQDRARAYKQVLSLLLAQRRPAQYLVSQPEDLEMLTNKYLRALEQTGFLDKALMNAALELKLDFQSNADFARTWEINTRKSATTERVSLLSLLNVSSFYRLDRLDLNVQTSLDIEVQEQVRDFLVSLRDPDQVKALGLNGHRLLDRGDPSQVIYSFTLYEAGPGGNHLRVQTDNLNRPLNVNQGTKLDLGSTAKLRTLVTYLEIVAKLHGRYQGLPRAVLADMASAASDPINTWVLTEMARGETADLDALLQAALQRRYSASPSEAFFTGGGLHRFANFNASDNAKRYSVANALQHSINLVFIRLMRDIVDYHMAEGGAWKTEILRDVSHPARRSYLTRYANGDASRYLNRFYERYRYLESDEILVEAANRAKRATEKVSLVFRYIRPDADVAALMEFLHGRFPERQLSLKGVEKLYQKYDPAKWSLADLGYISGVHPLELWLAQYLFNNPHAPRLKMLADSADTRLNAYGWLFATKNKKAQDRSIRIMLEEEAFRQIHKSWKRLGYPFNTLVASYATSIGSSADKPAALAELMGIIVNDGKRLPTSHVNRLHFAQATPYETVMTYDPGSIDYVMAPEVASALKSALVDVVEKGTARRARGAFTTSDGEKIVIGGKTGTGDHQFKQIDSNGRVINSRSVSRSATFVFFLGERFFGTLTTVVLGEESKNYGFTSSLPVQLVKTLAPTLQPLLDREPDLSP